MDATAMRAAIAKARKLERQRARRKNSECVSGWHPGPQIKHLFEGPADYKRTYERLFAEQNGLCKICKKPEPRGNRLSIDHDHKTDVIRGLLCFSCNHKLGWLEKWFPAIMEYLFKW